MEKIKFCFDESGDSVEFFVLEQTKINGASYILVTDSQEDDAECLILKEGESQDAKESVYEIVEDDVELQAVSKVFEERTVNQGKGRQLPKKNHHEQRYHEPCHLAEREGERELKVVDSVNDFLHAPYACIAFDFLQCSQLLSFLNGNSSLFSQAAA